MTIQKSTNLMNDVDVITRIFDHIDNSTTDRGEASWQEPTSNYHSKERLSAELDLMRRRSIVFCPAAAMLKSGDFVAREAAGIPLIAVRGDDGVVRAFRNACRHRGVQVAAGEGCTHAFVCPYHGWTYGLDGDLRHIPHETGFPDVDVKTKGLVPVACKEIDGLIFINQDIKADFDKDLPRIPNLIPKAHRLFRSDVLDINVNWKLYLESSLEGYHIRSTHKRTFYPVQYDNLTVVEAFGQNTRIAFPYQSIEGLRHKPKAAWHADGRLTYVYHLFPNVVISTFPGFIQVVVLEPLGLEVTRQHSYLLADCAEGDKEAEAAIMKGLEFAAIGALEDQAVVLSAQQGLKSGANTHLNFGLFENGIVRLHSGLSAELSL